MKLSRIALVLTSMYVSLKIVSPAASEVTMNNKEPKDKKETVRESISSKDPLEEGNIKHVIEQIYLPVIYQSVWSNYYDIEQLLAKKMKNTEHRPITLSNLFYLYNGDELLSSIRSMEPSFKDPLMELKSMDDTSIAYKFDENNEPDLDNDMFVPLYENNGKKRFDVISQPIPIMKEDLRTIGYRASKVTENVGTKYVEEDLRELILKHEDLLTQLKDLLSYL